MAAILQYQVTRPLEAAEKSGFAFVKKEKKYQAKSDSKARYIEKVGGLKAFWIIMSFVGIPLAIVFGIYEAFMAQSAIASFIDPMGNGTVDTTLISLIGAGLAVFAIFVGHIFAEGFQKETDAYTGRTNRNIGLPFYFSIVGLIGYVLFQYYLVQAAGEGESQFDSFAMIAIGVAILEILVGVLILGKALTYLLIFYFTIQLWFLSRGMGNKSRSTNESYRDYRTLRDAWNSENVGCIMELEGNDNIRRAIAYYGGINLENNSSEPISPNEHENESITENIPSQSVQETSEAEVEDFINNDDDNVTF